MLGNFDPKRANVAALAAAAAHSAEVMKFHCIGAMHYKEWGKRPSLEVEDIWHGCQRAMLPADWLLVPGAGCHDN